MPVSSVIAVKFFLNPLSVFYTSGYRSIQILHLDRALLTRLQDTGVGRRVVLLFSVAFSGPTLPHSRML